MTAERITTVADVYQFVERLKAASQQNGALELNQQQMQPNFPMTAKASTLA
jgi:hypothetical protein